MARRRDDQRRRDEDGRNPTRAAARRVDEIRAEWQARGLFAQADFRVDLDEKMRDFQEEAYAGWLDKLAEDSKQRAKRDAEESTPTLPGFQFDLDGEYQFDGLCVRKRMATREHFLKALASDDANLRSCMRKNLYKHEEWSLLDPYWNEEMSKDQAITAYRSANTKEAG